MQRTSASQPVCRSTSLSITNTLEAIRETSTTRQEGGSGSLQQQLTSTSSIPLVFRNNRIETSACARQHVLPGVLSNCCGEGVGLSKIEPSGQ